MASSSRSKNLRCRLGIHSYVERHPAEERPHGPLQRVCQRCGRRRYPDPRDLPPGSATGGGMAR